MLATPQILGCFAPIEVTGVRAGLYGTDRGFAMASDRVYVDNDSGGRIHAGVCGAMRGFWLSLIHISEPTRLGMISYAVFCLKKKSGGLARVDTISLCEGPEIRSR